MGTYSTIETWRRCSMLPWQPLSYTPSPPHTLPFMLYDNHTASTFALLGLNLSLAIRPSWELTCPLCLDHGRCLCVLVVAEDGVSIAWRALGTTWEEIRKKRSYFMSSTIRMNFRPEASFPRPAHYPIFDWIYHVNDINVYLCKQTEGVFN